MRGGLTKRVASLSVIAGLVACETPGTGGVDAGASVDAVAIGEDAAASDARAETDAGIVRGGVPAEYLYGVDEARTELVRIHLADGRREPLVPLAEVCALVCPTLAVDPVRGHVYYGGNGLSWVRRYSVDTQEDLEVLTSTTGIYGFRWAGDEDTLYYSDARSSSVPGDQAILRAKDAEGATRVVLAHADARFEVDPQRRTLWVFRGLRVDRVGLDDGRRAHALGDVTRNVFSLAQDPVTGLLAFAVAETPGVFLAAPDGRGSRLASAESAALGIPYGLTIDPGSGRLAWHTSSGGTTRTFLADAPDAPPMELADAPTGDVVFDGRAGPPLAEPFAEGTPRPMGSLLFTPCEDAPELECATLEAPIDHADPGGPKVMLPVRRHRALRGDLRVGVLFFDFGGPGYSFIDRFVHMLPDDNLAGSGTAILDRFDLVALERRGTGGSTPRFACARIPGSFPRHPTEREIAAGVASWQSARTDCADHPLTAHMGSLDVAEDLDLLRRALGEEQISLLTWSYGTTVAATYATHMAEHARAIVMVSPTRPNQTSEDRIRTRSALEESAYFDFFAWCADHATECELATAGDDASAVKTKFDALLADLHTRPIRVGVNRWDDLALLTQFSAHAWFPVVHWRVDARAYAQALGGQRDLLARIFRAESSGDGVAFLDSGSEAYSVFLGAHGIDRPFSRGTTDDDVIALVRETSASLEYSGANLALQTGPLAAWPVPAHDPLVIGPSPAPPALIIRSRFDYATNADFGEEMQAALGNGSHLVTYEGHEHSVTQVDDCTGAIATAFLLDPSHPPEVTTCPEIPPARWVRPLPRPAHNRTLGWSGDTWTSRSRCDRVVASEASARYAVEAVIGSAPDE